MPAADQCVAIVAAAQVLCIAKVLPKIKAGQLEAALPLAIEESLLGDAEVQHVVPGAVTADGKTVLYAVDKARLRLWVEACAAASIRLRRVVPEYWLVQHCFCKFEFIRPGARAERLAKVSEDRRRVLRGYITSNLEGVKSLQRIPFMVAL